MSNPDLICLKCGICCDGTLFSGVVLQGKDDPQKLRALGLPIRRLRAGARFPQPCAALSGCRCTIYPNRPQYCRRFECLLLKQQLAGKLPRASALILIRKAKRLARKAAKLLISLGDLEDGVALRQRFKKMAARLNQVSPTQEQASRFCDLSSTMHQLNLLLSDRFYPSEGELL